MLGSRAAQPRLFLLLGIQRRALCSNATTAVVGHDSQQPVAASTQPLLVAFNSLGLSAEMRSALNEMGIRRPSPVQTAVVPKLLKGESAYVAAPTGTGKTLAYLMPVMQRLRAAEKEDGGRCRQMNRPRAIVLVPSRELARQISKVAKSLSHHSPCRSMLIIGGQDGVRKVQRSTFSLPVDLVIATPGRLMQYLNNKELFLSQLRHIVVDEADTLLSAGPGNAFGTEVQDFLQRVVEGDLNPQVCLCSATLPPAMQRYLQKHLPSVKPVTVSGLHTKLRQVGHNFIRVLTHEDKHRELLHLLAAHKVPTMVFCNTVASCRATEHFLKESGHNTACYHGEMPPGIRSTNFTAFMSNEASVLICTDIAARGLDTAFVGHVIMFDFPLNAVDFIHRAGRTGRQATENGMAASQAEVSSLVTKRDLLLAKRIEHASKNDDLSVLTGQPIVKPRKAAAATARAGKSAQHAPNSKKSPSRDVRATAVRAGKGTLQQTSQKRTKKRTLKKLRSGSRKAPLLGEAL